MVADYIDQASAFLRIADVVLQEIRFATFALDRRGGLASSVVI